jgi:hypothetical protein
MSHCLNIPLIIQRTSAIAHLSISLLLINNCESITREIEQIPFSTISLLETVDSQCGVWQIGFGCYGHCQGLCELFCFLLFVANQVISQIVFQNTYNSEIKTKLPTLQEYIFPRYLALWLLQYVVNYWHPSNLSQQVVNHEPCIICQTFMAPNVHKNDTDQSWISALTHLWFPMTRGDWLSSASLGLSDILFDVEVETCWNKQWQQQAAAFGIKYLVQISNKTLVARISSEKLLQINIIFLGTQKHIIQGGILYHNC